MFLIIVCYHKYDNYFGHCQLEEIILKKGLNSGVTVPHSNLDFACATESVVSKLPSEINMKFKWRIRSATEVKTFAPNITEAEVTAFRLLKLNKDIRILQANKENCTEVMDESTYKKMLSILLESEVYEPLPKDPTSKLQRRVQKLLSNHK
jgi:hypothetical protein